jgi:hypothetical protein
MHSVKNKEAFLEFLVKQGCLPNSVPHDSF